MCVQIFRNGFCYIKQVLIDIYIIVVLFCENVLPRAMSYWRRSLRWSNYWPFQANHINDGMFIEDLVTWCRLLHYNVIKENSDLRNNSCRPYFIVIQIWVGIIFMRFSEGLNLMNIMPTHIWITIKYGRHELFRF